jgi:hypothetical protein
MDNTKNFNLKKPSAEDWYNIQDHNDNMDIVDAELKKLNDGKAPSGHGLGTKMPVVEGSFVKAIQKGGGFYAVNDATDSPLDNGNWMTLIQTVRMLEEGEETGIQLAFHDLISGNPKMWIRNLKSGDVSNWFEMLHTGNIDKYADAKFACGTYTGVLSGSQDSSNGIESNPFYRSKTLPLPFKADYIDVICVDDYTWRINIARNVNKAILMWQDHSVNQKTSVKWSGNNVTWGNSIPSNETGNLAVMNNAGYTYAWFAYGKGEGV